ncbi:MAG: hypothetical protein LAN36_14595 [Acidobacteriia bacterium]|nr:hypothetical protein [Terriglobia bacterium]
MKTRRGASILFAVAALVSALTLAAGAGAQQPSKSSSTPAQSQGGMAGMNMDDMQKETAQYPEAAKAANDAMSGMNMDSNPHMFMTVLQPKNPGDDQRADEILDILRKSITKYKDYRVALADGYQIFLPNVPQQQYHFTNYHYGFMAAFLFNPAHPTSLLYKKTSSGYELQGVMFTAPKTATEQQLDERVPLSIARWHEHVNFCMPPKSTPAQQVNWKQFGLAGSIATEDACAQAGGRWVKQIFGWMVHVYPFESDPSKIWAH